MWEELKDNEILKDPLCMGKKKCPVTVNQQCFKKNDRINIKLPHVGPEYRLVAQVKHLINTLLNY